MATSTTTNGTQRGIAGLTESQRYRLLASGRRRTLLAVLADGSGPVGVEDLAPVVAEREDDAAGTRGDGEQSVRIALHHVHLPMLDDAGLVDYDPESHQVDPDRASLDRLAP